MNVQDRTQLTMCHGLAASSRQAVSSVAPTRLAASRHKVGSPTTRGTYRALRAIRAFTLIELLLVLVILAVLASLVVPKLVGRGEDAKKTAARHGISTIGGLLDLFEQDNGRFPTNQEGVKALIDQPPGLTNWKGPYLKSNVGDDPAKDPWGNVYNYVSPGTHNKDYDLFSSGPNGQAGDDDDIVNWQKN